MNLLKKIGLLLCFCMLTLVAYTQDTQNVLTKKEKKQGWTLLFDGTTNKGWTKANGKPFPENGWQISNGSLTVLENQKGGDIVTIDEFSDFELSVDFLMSKTSCSFLGCANSSFFKFFLS